MMRFVTLTHVHSRYCCFSNKTGEFSAVFAVPKYFIFVISFLSFCQEWKYTLMNCLTRFWRTFSFIRSLRIQSDLRIWHQFAKMGRSQQVRVFLGNYTIMKRDPACWRVLNLRPFAKELTGASFEFMMSKFAPFVRALSVRNCKELTSDILR